jgi:3-phosphoglycerate kinase
MTASNTTNAKKLCSEALLNAPATHGALTATTKVVRAIPTLAEIRKYNAKLDAGHERENEEDDQEQALQDSWLHTLSSRSNR